MESYRIRSIRMVGGEGNADHSDYGKMCGVCWLLSIESGRWMMANTRRQCEGTIESAAKGG